MGYWVDMTTPTGRWTPTTSSPSGGRSSRSSTRACWSRTTGSRRTARAAAPACPTTSWRQGYETVVDPSVYVRFPLTSGPAGRHGAVAAGLDDDAVDAGVQHRRRGAPRRHLRGGAPTAPSALVVAEPLLAAGARRGLDGDRRALHRRGAGALDLPAAVRAGRDRRTRTIVVLADYVTTEDGTGPGAPGARVRRRRPRDLPARTACRWSTRSRPDGRSTPSCPLVGGHVLQGRRRGAGRATCASAACCSAHAAVRAQLPALLALPHAADLLRAAVLVHPHHRGQGRAAARERAHQLVPGDDQARPLRRLAEQQRRLGAVPQPLLGHAAADLALRRRPPDLRRLARRARRAGRPRPVRPRPAPAVRRRGHASPARRAGRPPRGCPR